PVPLPSWLEPIIWLVLEVVRRKVADRMAAPGSVFDDPVLPAAVVAHETAEAEPAPPAGDGEWVAPEVDLRGVGLDRVPLRRVPPLQDVRVQLLGQHRGGKHGLGGLGRRAIPLGRPRERAADDVVGLAPSAHLDLRSYEIQLGY